MLDIEDRAREEVDRRLLQAIFEKVKELRRNRHENNLYMPALFSLTMTQIEEVCSVIESWIDPTIRHLWRRELGLDFISLSSWMDEHGDPEPLYAVLEKYGTGKLEGIEESYPSFVYGMGRAGGLLITEAVATTLEDRRGDEIFPRHSMDVSDLCPICTLYFPLLVQALDKLDGLAILDEGKDCGYLIPDRFDADDLLQRAENGLTAIELDIIEALMVPMQSTCGGVDCKSEWHRLLEAAPRLWE